MAERKRQWPVWVLKYKDRSDEILDWSEDRDELDAKDWVDEVEIRRGRLVLENQPPPRPKRKADRLRRK